MAQRSDLHEIFKGLTANVYFQPPPGLQMEYPCIRYNRRDEDVDHAGNKLYARRKQYQVTVIDRDPDSALPDAVGELPLCEFDRHYTADGLNHDVYNLFF